jgi:hypothetical protein
MAPAVTIADAYGEVMDGAWRSARPQYDRSFQHGAVSPAGASYQPIFGHQAVGGLVAIGAVVLDQGQIGLVLDGFPCRWLILVPHTCCRLP